MAIKSCLAVKKLHQSKLLHMDLKTDNIFMLNKYTPALGDFGMVHTFTSASTERDAMGTLIYVAYEIVSGKPTYSEKSDVYALAVLIYELFQGVELDDQILYSKLLNYGKKDLVKNFDKYFRKALDYFNAKNRQTIDELIRDLLQLLKDYSEIHYTEVEQIDE